MSNAPYPLTAKEETKLKAYRVDVTLGKIYNSRGWELGGHNNDGYITLVIYVEGKRRSLRRANVIWWAHTGKWPTTVIDHKNRIQYDDRIENLRESNDTLNALNRTYTERSLPRGVLRNKHSKRHPYIATISLKGICTYLGCYATVEEASKAYERARAQSNKEIVCNHK